MINNFFDLITGLFLLILGLNLVISFWLLSKLAQAKKKQAKMEGKSEQFLKRAEEGARKIIERATEKASKTLAETNSLKKEMIKELEVSLENLRSDLMEKFSEETKVAQEIYHEEEKKFVSNLEKKILEEAQSHEKNLEKEIQAEFQRTKEDVKRYKDEKLKEVEKEINKIIERVLEEAGAKSISLEDHEKLVLEALEKAKKEVF